MYFSQECIQVIEIRHYDEPIPIFSCYTVVICVTVVTVVTSVIVVTVVTGTCYSVTVVTLVTSVTVVLPRGIAARGIR